MNVLIKCDGSMDRTVLFTCTMHYVRYWSPKFALNLEGLNVALNQIHNKHTSLLVYSC